ncbi:unnamed protein product [Lepeophtheirus salmonis]|uniref:(salmon louse) hypothetical protein n=1 Tax=Lepeophtheirus salmonis TaxID=72036 RepID=A0A7R8H5E6_LEPSM|nr:unnamed protein product [Lepeophtheirus salmonis]CAF2866792.1 unnamed protein product [Lepeophtheirus salmonis]
MSPFNFLRSKRKSLPHFSDFSLYPDRFNPPNKTRHRTLSAGSDLLIPIDDDVSQSVRDIDEEILAVEGSKMMKKSNTHHFAFFDYSMIPDKDPKANSKMSSSSP